MRKQENGLVERMSDMKTWQSMSQQDHNFRYVHTGAVKCIIRKQRKNGRTSKAHLAPSKTRVPMIAPTPTRAAAPIPRRLHRRLDRRRSAASRLSGVTTHNIAGDQHETLLQ
ncbi:hypothetical protein KIN20_033721 [Parelaphostrongylus tenuis]|uniref:Uncharacterized protein n=1 Tax=Parelaphostrongylus tenuis TaxID=148309 RepID=A0AAD5R8W4_PARTN|nr:hypothetical protein KIN20_033721 [Parelaphostrongylus tenuis]